MSKFIYKNLVIAIIFFVISIGITFAQDKKPILPTMPTLEVPERILLKKSDFTGEWYERSPFGILQRQIDDLNQKINFLHGQSCPEGKFVVGIDDDGYIICRGGDSSAEIIASGLGLENHLSRSFIKITPETLPEETYIMGCQKSNDSVGLVGTDPFDSEHANFRIEFGQQFFGATMDALAVEIFSAGDTNSSAYVELIDESTNDVLATSNTVSTSSTGWIEFVFNSDFIISQSQILVNFETTTNARIYNCAGFVEFIPY